MHLQHVSVSMKPLVLLVLILQAFRLTAQLSITNPQICHDRQHYLSSYNDGTYIFRFSKSQFTSFQTVIPAIWYLEAEKKIIFLYQWSKKNRIADTVQIQLLAHSIVFTRKDSVVTITSLSQLPAYMPYFGINRIAEIGEVDGFSFWAADFYFEVDVSRYKEGWGWKIKRIQENQKFALVFNGLKKNRLEYIFIADDSARYGMDLSTSSPAMEKVWRMRSVYSVDTLTDEGKRIFIPVVLDKEYYYEYDKRGRLQMNTLKGELKLCD